LFKQLMMIFYIKLNYITDKTHLHNMQKINKFFLYFPFNRWYETTNQKIISGCGTD
jgi:hypothetical protein